MQWRRRRMQCARDASIDNAAERLAHCQRVADATRRGCVADEAVAAVLDDLFAGNAVATKAGKLTSSGVNEATGGMTITFKAKKKRADKA